MGKQSITTDANGWTWIFRNNKNPNTKPIENPYHKDLEKVATSFYVSNIPDSLDAKGLWKVCVSYGRLVDAYIANKLSKGGKRFDFIRFLGVKGASDFNSKSHPSFASVLHNKPNPATTTPSQAITRSVILNDHDLISVEDSSTCILVKLKDMDSMSNMYTI
ncbi:RNA-directed DNA polymerase, eukaryota, reverse transcriptase zinc-binding domain protein, partial [Tanacetum coccineum]